MLIWETVICDILMNGLHAVMLRHRRRIDVAAR
jgi:hypothetical protein